MLLEFEVQKTLSGTIFIVRTHITDRFIEFFELHATCHNDILSLETFYSIITVVKINLYCIVTKMTLSLSLEVEYDECKLFIDQLQISVKLIKFSTLSKSRKHILLESIKFLKQYLFDNMIICQLSLQMG